MATYEFEYTNCNPSLINGGLVGQGEVWRGTGKTITGIRAKLSSGSGTFNVKQGKPNAPLLDNSDFDADGDLLWHLRARDLHVKSDGTVRSDGDNISTWYSYDKNLASFRQQDSAREPTYKTNTGPGSNEGITFDSDFLDGYGGTHSLPYDADFTIFVVVGDFTSGNNRPIVGTIDTSSGSWKSIWGHKGGDLRVRNDSGDEYNHDDVDINDDEIRCLRCVNQSTTISQVTEWINGGTGLSSPFTGLYEDEDITIDSSTGGWTFNGLAAAQRLYRGSTQSRWFKGAISEIILFDTALSDTNRELIEGYLAHFYGLTADLPTPHDYKTTNPLSTPEFLLSSDMILKSVYNLTPSINFAVEQGHPLNFYLTECQNPGTLTVEITLT